MLPLGAEQNPTLPLSGSFAQAEVVTRWLEQVTNLPVI